MIYAYIITMDISPSIISLMSNELLLLSSCPTVLFLLKLVHLNLDN